MHIRRHIYGVYTSPDEQTHFPNDSSLTNESVNKIQISIMQGINVALA